MGPDKYRSQVIGGVLNTANNPTFFYVPTKSPDPNP